MKLDRKRLAVDPLGTIKDALMTEAQFLGAVIALAKHTGWVVAHFRPARTEKGWRTPVSADGQGFPDLVLSKPPRLIFAELKSESGRLTQEQQIWLDKLRVNQEVYVWKPRDWEWIVATLQWGLAIVPTQREG